MAMSGTYVAEVPLKGSAEKHYKRYKSETHLFPDAIGHHIQGVNMHHGDSDSHGSIRSWNYTCDGKQESFKEKRELHDANMVVTKRGLEGHVMDQFKLFDIIYQFIPKSREGCVCKITLIWEKKNEDTPEPINYMKFLKSLVADMDDHVLKSSA
ncbi:unnamed protein product [Microthlaspi erraticum]|uniref:Bet v I/Major latex protein domain-containing protein n=1 Tax=Microthlaspi erraticum TaxID=1685480 RepID=A0A6D2J905_9BRAS|nr:unnamed protein product [Microthlaspi erraticum]